MPIRQTYFALRAGLVVLVLLLFVAVALEILGVGCRLGSISAYFHTSVRSVFVGTLCAIGAILLIYRGNTDTENMLLNFAGFLAFLVAFVPTELDQACPGVADEAIISNSVANNVWAVLFIGLLITILNVLFDWRSSGRDNLSTYARVALTISALGLAAGVAVFVWNRELVLEAGHAATALGFFALIIAVVWANALDLHRQEAPSSQDSKMEAARTAARNRYGIVAIVMTITTVIGVPLVIATQGLLFWLEAVLIVEFAVFWFLQTRELKGAATRAMARGGG